MGTPTKHLSSFTCELKIQEAKNMKSTLRGNLFVRYYLPCGLGNKRAVRLETPEIPAKRDHVWDETVSLECRGIDINEISRAQSVIFELRLRSSVSLFGGSKLLGRAEISLGEILGSPNTVLDRWLSMVSTRGDVSPKLKVEIKTRDLEVCEGKLEGKRNWNMCGCRDGQHHDHHGFTCDYYDAFALLAAIEA